VPNAVRLWATNLYSFGCSCQGQTGFVRWLDQAPAKDQSDCQMKKEAPTTAVTASGQDGYVRDARYTVRSVARALEAIELVSDGPSDGLSLSELSRGLGISKSSALATARTLAREGFLREAQPGPRYKLGMALIRLGDLTARQQPVGDLCQPILRQLAKETQLTARLAIAEKGFPVFVDRVDGQGTVRFHTPLGIRERPHATAAGKAILATLSASEVRAICQHTGLTRHTPQTITRIEELLSELKGVRARGFAVDNEEDAQGVFCVGAAFADHRGICVGALSVTGIKADVTESRLEELGGIVRAHADQVSATLQGRS
jgi:IclR family acetate operon transcriptional repressor